MSPEKTTAWTAEELAEIARQREIDSADAYEKGPDGKRLRLKIDPRVLDAYRKMFT